MNGIGTKANWTDALVGFLLLGYLSMTRSFAHLGVAPLFVGEVALGTFLFTRPRSLLRPWLGALMQANPFSFLAWAMFLSLGFGVVQCWRGIYAGHDTMTTLKSLVFHLYPLFFFPGVWAAQRHPDFLRKLLRMLAWCHGIYGTLYITVLSPMGLCADGDHHDVIAWFGQPGGAAVVLLGMISFERHLARMWLPLMLNVFVLLGVQVRAEWLGFAVCLPLWGLLSGRCRQVANLAAILLGLLAAGLITDFRIPSPTTRGGELTTRSLVGRAVAPIDPKLAASFTARAESYASTASWRTGWWREIWKMVHESVPRTLFGPGYGYPIWDLHPEDLNGVKLRTPHNGFMYALGYTGWSGVVVFYTLQLCLAGLLWQAYRVSGQPFGLCFWTLILVWSTFDNFFEAPYGAIPFYLIAGLCMAPVLSNPQALGRSGDRPESPKAAKPTGCNPWAFGGQEVPR